MNSIKILFITARADLGGGPKSMNTIAGNLSDKFEVYVCSPKDKPYYDLYKGNKKIKDIYVIPHRKFSLRKFLGLIFFVKRNKIQIVNSNGNGAGLYSRLLKLFCPRLKIVHTFRGINIKERGSLKRKIYFFYERCFKYLTDIFINVSYGEQQVSHALHITNDVNSLVIYNGIEPLNKQDVPERLKEYSNQFVVCSLSRFDYQKNMNLSCEIASQLKEYQDIVLIWVGDGPEKKTIEQHIKEKELKNIILTGFDANVAEYLSIANIYLSTARWEGLPLALLEAASIGVPIVASDVTGNNEVVQNGIDSFVFDPNNPDEAVEKIIELYSNKNLYEKFSTEISQTFKNKFDKKIMVNNTENLFLKMMAK